MDRRLTTIMAADLVGYSRLMASDEEGVIARLRAARADVVDPEIARAGGRIVKTMGDGLLVEFGSPVAAVRAALAVQPAMVARETGPEDARLRFRIGINLGDVVIDGDDFLGDGVNIAARLESVAPPGGICLSHAVHEQVRGKLDAPLIPLGPQMVKNLPEPVDVWRVEVAGAAAEQKAVTQAERPSIAVLPFDNMSSDPDQEFLADGIVEDITTELSRFRWLLVIARNSTFSYKGTHKDVREIARELGVRYVVEGSVRRAGNRLRVTVQLIEAETGDHLWANRYDRIMEDLFDLQDEVTHAIVSAVEPELGAHERTLARRKPTDDLSAWELYQRGLSEYLKMNAAALEEAQGLFAASIDTDPDFALAYAGLARCHAYELLSGRSSDPRSTLEAGFTAARRALDLDHRCDAAHHALGFLETVGKKSAAAAETLSRGIALNPNNALLYFTRGQAYCAEGEYGRAITDAREALRLSPSDPSAWAFRTICGIALVLRGQEGDANAARAELEAACRLSNADWPAFFALAVTMVELEEPDEARRQLAAALEKRPGLTLAAAKAGLPVPFDTDENLKRLTAATVELGLPAE